MNIALFLLLSVQLHQSLSNNFDVELENGDHVVLPSNGDSQESYSTMSGEIDENGISQKSRPRSQAGSIASNQQCRKCKSMKCIKEKCESVLLAIVQGCKLCKNNKACQKKRCPKDKDKQQLALLAQMAQLGQIRDPDQTEGMCSWCRKNRQMWVCKCLSCSNKKRKCPKFCGHWYYKQLFACKKKKGSNADGDGNYAKLPGFQDDKDLNR